MIRIDVTTSDPFTGTYFLRTGSQLIDSAGKFPMISPDVPYLSPRENDVHDLMKIGLNAYQISKKLWMDYRSAKRYVVNVRKKLSAHEQMQNNSR